MRDRHPRGSASVTGEGSSTGAGDQGKERERREPGVSGGHNPQFSEEPSRAMEANGHLQPGFPFRRMEGVGVGRVAAPPGERHVPGPGIFGMGGSANQKEISPLRRGTQDNRDRCHPSTLSGGWIVFWAPVGIENQGEGEEVRMEDGHLRPPSVRLPDGVCGAGSACAQGVHFGGSTRRRIGGLNAFLSSEVKLGWGGWDRNRGSRGARVSDAPLR